MQLIAEVERGIGHQLDFHQRVVIGHLRHQRAEPGMDHCVHHADAHATGLAGAGLDRLFERLHGVHHLLGVIKHLEAFGRQAHAARITQEQLHPELAFKHGNPAGNRGLSGEELVGGQAETLESGDPDKGLEKLQVHGIKISYV
ncbi:hypothetical protein D9M73_175660 [compost metagenome]